jgi:hypothetical protein
MRSLPLLSVGAVFVAMATLLHAAPPPAVPQTVCTGLTVDLRDGSRLLGRPLSLEALPLHTTYGKLEIPLIAIKSFQMNDDRESATVHLRNGENWTGTLGLGGLSLRTSIGKLDVPLAEVASCRADVGVARPDRGGESLRRGLVLHYPFDEQSDQVRDSSPCGNHGSVHGAKHVDGKRGGAYRLNGDNQYIAIPNSNTVEVRSAVTVATWVKLHSFGPGGYGNEHGYIVDKGNDLWWNPAFCLGYAKGSGSSQPRWPGKPGPFPALFHIGDDESAKLHGNHGGKTVLSESKLEVDKWYHLAGTYDGKRVKIYINGRLEGEVPFEKPIRHDNAPIHIGGGKLFSTGWGNQFTVDGTIDEVRIYDRALSADEIKRLHRLVDHRRE